MKASILAVISLLFLKSRQVGAIGDQQFFAGIVIAFVGQLFGLIQNRLGALLPTSLILAGTGTLGISCSLSLKALSLAGGSKRSPCPL